MYKQPIGVVSAHSLKVGLEVKGVVNSKTWGGDHLLQDDGKKHNAQRGNDCTCEPARDDL